MVFVINFSLSETHWFAVAAVCDSDLRDSGEGTWPGNA
jgi:hypothetical protein